MADDPPRPDRPAAKPIRTPDGKYLVVEGKAGPRLWRAANPALSPDAHDRLVAELMDARRAVRAAKGDEHKLALARRAVQAAKVALGERGPVWWNDGEPDLNRHLVRNTPYAHWWQRVRSSGGRAGKPS